MMKKLIPLALYLTLLIFSACKKSPTDPHSGDPLLQEAVRTTIDSLWNAYLDENDLQTGGLLLYANHAGRSYQCKSNLPENVSANSMFRAASITKTFTASAIMLLQQDMLLDIDDFISDTMPGRSEPYVLNNANFNIPFKNQITIRMLLEHRAGVYDHTNYDIPDSVSAPYAGQNWFGYILESDPMHAFNIEEIISVLAGHQLYSGEPGAAYSYSNTGYMLLGEIIERVSGQSYEQFVHSHLLLPNSLESTSFPLDVSHTMPSNSIPGYVYLESNAIPADVYNMSMEFGQGNLVTNAQDLLSWLLRWQTGAAGLPQSVVDQMRHSQYPDQEYGLGTSYSPGFGYGHTGAIAGYISLMFYDPITEYGFVLLCNVWNLRDWDTIDLEAYKLFDIAAKAKTMITAEQPERDRPVFHR